MRRSNSLFVAGVDNTFRTHEPAVVREEDDEAAVCSQLSICPVYITLNGHGEDRHPGWTTLDRSVVRPCGDKLCTTESYTTSSTSNALKPPAALPPNTARCMRC